MDNEKPLKPYRSKAERIAIKQRWIQIGLTCFTLTISLASLTILMLHYVFHII